MSKEYNPFEHSVVQACGLSGSYRRYEVSDFVEALVFHIKAELERVYWNWNQRDFEEHDWQFVEIPGFAWRRYFWDDCDCGADSPVHAKDCDTQTKQREWVSRRIKAMTDPGGSGRMIDFTPEREAAFLRTDPRPICTCGAEAAWKPRDTHLPDCSPHLPNLKFEDVEICWYKHPGRGMSTNVSLDERGWRGWLDRCLMAIRGYDTCFGFHEERRHKADCDCPKGRKRKDGAE